MATAVGNANHLDRAEKAHSAVDCRVWAMLPTPKTPKTLIGHAQHVELQGSRALDSRLRNPRAACDKGCFFFGFVSVTSLAL